MIQEDCRAAIDVGDSKVVAMLAVRRPNRRIELIGAGVVPSVGMSRGAITDPAEVAASIQDAIAKASAQAGMPIARAYVGLSGSHVESFNRTADVPRSGNVSPVTDHDLNAAVHASSAMDLGPDKKLLHVIPQGYSLDGLHGVRNPLGMHTAEMKIHSHVAAGSESYIEALDQAVRAAGIAPSEFIVEPVATGESVLAADERDEGVALIDIGAGDCGISVYREGSLFHTDYLPVGGHHITNDLAISFSLDYAVAEELKRSKGTAAPELVKMSEETIVHPQEMDEPVVVTIREIGHVVKERVQEIFSMILLRLEEEELPNMPINNIVFTGGGSKLQGFESLARYVFQRKVRIGLPRGLEGLPDEYRDPAYATAAGIVLWGMRNLPRENHVGYSSEVSPVAPARPKGPATGIRGFFQRLFGWLGNGR